MRHKLFAIPVSDNADDEIWHDLAVQNKLEVFDHWFKKTGYKRDKDYIFIQNYVSTDYLLTIEVFVEIRKKWLEVLYKLRW
tara:strand:+ start:200 stop:442 length:243 start_codon:yes stop_codon:yes gene_type:complete